jgi:putative transposase
MAGCIWPAVLGLYLCHVIGWPMSDRMTAILVCNALGMAVIARHRQHGVNVHSGRDSQYCSQDYRRALKGHGLPCRMSKKGGSFDNAAMESGIHT